MWYSHSQCLFDVRSVQPFSFIQKDAECRFDLSEQDNEGSSVERGTIGTLEVENGSAFLWLITKYYRCQDGDLQRGSPTGPLLSPIFRSCHD